MGARLARRRAAAVTLLAVMVLGLIPVAAPPASAAYSSAVSPYLTGLNFPVGSVFAPDGRLFFTEKYTGLIRVVDTSGAAPQLLSTPFAVVGSLNTTSEMGLLGLAADPEWATTPWLYAYHTFDNGTVLENRITRFWAATNVSTLSEDIVTGIPAWDYHNGGILQFGPDGKLWVTTGDAHHGDRAGDPTYLGGKVLRFEKDGTIPTDNPLPGSPVFTMGHRNVFGLTFNLRTGAAYITENGEDTNDEVNALAPLGDYGWPWDEGFASNGTKKNPIWAITPTIAPTGIVASTSRHPSDNRTDLLFGDFSTSSLRRLVIGPPNYDTVLEEDLVFTRAVSGIIDLDFGPGGLLYLTATDGIYTSDLHKVGNQLPVPVILTNRTIQFEGVNISFDGRGSFDPEARGIFWHAWDFGDGNATNGTFVSHAFARAGNYTVNLTVTDELNTTNTSSIVIEIVTRASNRPPVPVLFASRTIQFVNRSIGFGGGDSTDPEKGGVRSHTWDFGDGTNATGSWAPHAYATRGNYTVRLTVTDEWGAPNSTTALVRILSVSENTPPVAVATASGGRGWTGIPFHFSMGGSSDAEGAIVGHIWDFGDGSNGTDAYATHVFALSGTFQVTLTVFDELGASSNATFAIPVLDAAQNNPPVPIITPPRGTAKVGVPLTFSGLASHDSEGGIFAYEWRFGDGGTESVGRAAHTYAHDGLFTVTLTVADELGERRSTAITLHVYLKSMPPNATFVENDWTGPVGEALYFDGSGSSDPDGLIAAATWDFGDGSTATGTQVWHYFPAPGDYEVRLTVVDDSGAERTAVSTVRITPAPTEAVAPWTPVVAIGAALALVLGSIAARPRKQ